MAKFTNPRERATVKALIEREGKPASTMAKEKMLRGECFSQNEDDCSSQFAENDSPQSDQ